MERRDRTGDDDGIADSSRPSAELGPELFNFLGSAGADGDKLPWDDDPRWPALSRGELDPDEVEALRLENPAMYEVYRPFTEEESARIWRGVSRRLRAAERRRMSG